jgi:NAD(P)-dependent dehydrogenase (short-subunit alcohol dehydrogenase family)
MRTAARLRRLRDQVVVITGASSGIGLTTAELAARRGACVVLAARNETDLRGAVAGIAVRGGRAIYVVADVSDPQQVERVAQSAIREFGRIDTWVNNAAAAMYGRLTDIPLADLRRQFDVTYWGQVYGSLAAVPHLRDRGGALINVSSCVADRAIPLQGNYSAAKHAIKGFTDSLRMELEEQGAPISVTLIKPSSINTPFFDKARAYTGREPQPVSPVYAPEVVAKAILSAAEHPVRDVIVGAGGRMLGLLNVAPRAADRFMTRAMFRGQQTDRPTNGRPDNLYLPVSHDGGRRGRNWTGRTLRTSAYTSATLHPRAVAAIVFGVAALLTGRAVAKQHS